MSKFFPTTLSVQAGGYVHPVSQLYAHLALEYKKQVTVMPRKTKEAAELTRLAILDSALSLFADQGVSRTTLADIAKEAGVTRGAIYWHFDNKSSLIQGLWQHHFGAFDERLEVHVKDAASLDVVLSAGKLWFEELQNNQISQKFFEINMFKIEYSAELEGLLKHDAEMLALDQQRFNATLENIQAQGGIKEGVNLEHITLGIFSMTWGLINQWLILGKSFDLVATGENILTGYINALRP